MEASVPALLRPVFRTHVEHHARITLNMVDEGDHEQKCRI